MPYGIVKSKKDEKAWSAAKEAMHSSYSKKPESKWTSKDYARTTGLFKKIKKSMGK